MINQFLLVELENLLGKATKTSKDNYSFRCPFCNHSKKKLEIDLATDSNGHNKFACWVCNTRGKTLKSLLFQMKVPKEHRYSILKYIKYSKGDATDYAQDVITLPKEFKPLSTTTSTNYIAKKANSYFYNRGVSDLDMLRYNIGYCIEGEYKGKVIVPSYDEDNNLTFFIGRTFEDDFFKYKNPSMLKEGVVFFENMINWDLPVTLVEGVFDAIAVKRNAIPILGKSLPASVYEKLIINGVKEVYISLDQDAKREALAISIRLLHAGITTYLVDLPNKDPGEMNLEEITHHIYSSEPLNEGMIIKHKINL